MKKLAILIVLALIIVSTALYSPLLKIQKFNIPNSGSCLSEDALQSSLNILGKNILLVSSQNITDEVRNKFPCATNVKVSKKFPSTLIIKANINKSVAQVEGTNWRLSKDGLATDAKDTPQLPKIFIPQDIQITVNEKIKDENVLFSLKMLKALEKSDFTPASARILDQNDVAFYSNQGVVALATSTKEVDIQVDSLQSVLAKAKMDAAKIEKIDLRFDKPIVTYKKQ